MGVVFVLALSFGSLFGYLCLFFEDSFSDVCCLSLFFRIVVGRWSYCELISP